MTFALPDLLANDVRTRNEWGADHPPGAQRLSLQPAFRTETDGYGIPGFVIGVEADDKPAKTHSPPFLILFTLATRSPRRFWNFDDPFNASADGVSMPMNTYMKFASTIAASNSGRSARSMDASV